MNGNAALYLLDVNEQLFAIMFAIETFKVIISMLAKENHILQVF